MRTLTFFVNILRRGAQSVEYQLIERQLAVKSSTSYSWVWYIQGLLNHYSLPSAFTLLKEQPGKISWKKMVKGTITRRWETELKLEAQEKSTLKFLNLKTCSLTEIHPIWKIGAADTLTVTKATNKVKLLTQRYPIFTSRTSGNRYGQPCPLCSTTAETLYHFLIECEALQSARKPYMNRIKKLASSLNIAFPIDDTHAVRLLLDPSYYASGPYLSALEAVTRNLCFSLHHKRSALLGRPSQYVHIRGKNLLQSQNQCTI